jgi:hypothetical protein
MKINLETYNHVSIFLGNSLHKAIPSFFYLVVIGSREMLITLNDYWPFHLDSQEYRVSL